MLRKILLSMSCVFFLAVSWTTAANTFVEGQHYIKLPPEVRQQAVVQTFMQPDQGKIQVVEFFSFKCGGCYAFEPVFSAWAAQQPKDVAIRRVPVAFNPTWEPLAKTYYVLEELQVAEKLTPVIFAAVHRDRKALSTQREVAALLSQNGVTVEAFNAAYQGFNVSRMWTQAQLLSQTEQVTSIPAIVVNGEYLTHLGMTNDTVMLTKVVDYLIAQSRSGK